MAVCVRLHRFPSHDASTGAHPEVRHSRGEGSVPHPCAGAGSAAGAELAHRVDARHVAAAAAAALVHAGCDTHEGVVYKVFFIQPDSPRAWELLGRVFEPYNGNVAAVHDKRCHYAQHYRKHTTAHWSPENAGRVVLPATKQGTTPTARPRIKTGSQPPFNQPAALTEQATRVCADGEDHPTHTPTPGNQPERHWHAGHATAAH